MNTGNYSDLNYFSVINNPTSFFTVGFASVFKALVSVIKLDISELSNNKLIIYFFQLLLIYILFKLVTQLVVITNTFIEKILGQKTSVFDNSKGLQGGMTKSAQIMSNSRKQFQKLGKTARNSALEFRKTKVVQAIMNSKFGHAVRTMDRKLLEAYDAGIKKPIKVVKKSAEAVTSFIAGDRGQGF